MTRTESSDIYFEQIHYGELKMKVDKFTRVLIQMLLILLIALLVKSLVILPKKAYGQITGEYKVSTIEEEVERLIKEVDKLDSRWWEKLTVNEKLTYIFNWNARNGWKFTNYIALDEEFFFIFKR